MKPSGHWVGAGFIGSSVVRLAIARGHRVINVDALTYAGRLENLKDVAHNQNYHFEHVDVRDRQSLDRTFKHHQPDAVMHLAAESHVDRSIKGPETFIDTNVVGTAVMLEASRKYWQGRGRPEQFRFHHVSTDSRSTAACLMILPSGLLNKHGTTLGVPIQRRRPVRIIWFVHGMGRHL